RKFAEDTVTASMVAHSSALDPHPQYMTQVEGDARYMQIGTGVRPGSILYSASKNALPGTLKANGAAVSVATYAALANAIYCGDENNATALFGYRCTDPANPSTSRATNGSYIVLPDLRGEFPRGWDDGRGIDAG